MYQKGTDVILRSGGVWKIEAVEADGYRLGRVENAPMIYEAFDEVVRPVMNEVQGEFDMYLRQLERKRTPYCLEKKDILADESILIHIRRQYNSYSTGTYLQ